jgi:hypothetical protein
MTLTSGPIFQLVTKHPIEFAEKSAVADAHYLNLNDFDNISHKFERWSVPLDLIDSCDDTPAIGANRENRGGSEFTGA